ncbi:MAG: hypothetical protein M1812_005719 [Candelaria pacifica]|nr:MAG: hypothetical protein M1812_005719 [Candelaria pacifica]
MSAIELPTDVDVSMTDERESENSSLYHEYNRGDLATLEVPARPCDINFLEVIVTDLNMIRDKWVLKHEHISHQHAQECLEAIQMECDRLHDAPELFPNSATMSHFFELVYALSTQIMDAIAALRQKDQCFQAQVELELKKTRPTYVNGLKPWDQFLANGAPGSGSGGVPPQRTIFQVVPYGGIQLLQSWEKELKEVTEFLDNIRNRRPQPRKIPPWSHTRVGLDADGLIRQNQVLIMRPNPFKRYRGKMNNEKLEGLGYVMKMLEGERVIGLNPHFYAGLIIRRVPRDWAPQAPAK